MVSSPGPSSSPGQKKPLTRSPLTRVVQVNTLLPGASFLGRLDSAFEGLVYLQVKGGHPIQM